MVDESECTLCGERATPKARETIWIGIGVGDSGGLSLLMEATLQNVLKGASIDTHSCDKGTVVLAVVEHLPWCILAWIWEELRAAEVTTGWQSVFGPLEVGLFIGHHDN